MTKEEYIDQCAIQAMNAQIQKFGISELTAITLDAYKVAERMWERREQIHNYWQSEAERKRRYENSNLKELGLPVRYHNCLTCEDIWMKEDLCNWTERELRRIPNLGMKGIEFIKQAMAEHGLKLKGQA